MFKILTQNKLFLIFVLGLLLHLIIMPRAFHGDMTNYDGWGKYMLDHGPSTIYNFSFRGQLLSDANYPPLMLWLCSLVSITVRLLKNISWQLNVMIPAFPSKLVFFFEGELPYIYIFKLILIVADFGIAHLVYLFVKRQLPTSKNAPLIAASLILFNPAIIFGTTIWGQIDILPVFFILASIYVLLYKKNITVSAILTVVALLFKQTTIVFLPIYFLAVLKYFSKKEVLKSAVIMIVAIWLGYAPFVSTWTNILAPFFTYLYKVQLASDNHLTTKSAWNFWVIFHGLTPVNDSHDLFLNLSYKTIGYILVFISLIVTLYSFWRKKEKDIQSNVQSTIYAYFLIALASFLFLTRLHERHLLQAIPFCIILYDHHKNYFLQLAYISLFIVANLFFVWHPINLIITVGSTQLLMIKISIGVMLGIFLYYQWSFFTVQKISKK